MNYAWKTADFIAIAKEQNRQEDEAAKTANKVLICDTDAFATGLWHERYMA
jgi:nicotinamide riboside kinase